MELHPVAEFCKELAAKAGRVIMEIYDEAQEIQVEIKADHSPVTRADKASNALIVEALAEQYPHWAILAEESADDPIRLANDWCFLVDPLDGTKQFIRRDGAFTVNIGLSHRGKSVMGVVYQPATREMYWAWEGGGAFYQAQGEAPRNCRVSDKLSGLLFVGSKSHSTPQEAQLLEAHAPLIAGRVQTGSSIKGCMVAAAQADVYYRFGPTWEWDTCAMQCVVEEAGGIFLQMDKTPLTYNRENPLNEKGFLAVNRRENIWV